MGAMESFDGGLGSLEEILARWFGKMERGKCENTAFTGTVSVDLRGWLDVLVADRKGKEDDSVEVIGSLEVLIFLVSTLPGGELSCSQALDIREAFSQFLFYMGSQEYHDLRLVQKPLKEGIGFVGWFSSSCPLLLDLAQLHLHAQLARLALHVTDGRNALVIFTINIGSGMEQDRKL